MVEALIVSNVVLWVLVLGLAVLVVALARQIGVLYERVAPMGALMMDTGPKVGEAAPPLDLVDLDGGPLSLGAPGARSRLLFFVAPGCPVCKKLIPIVRHVAERERGWLEVVFASDGDPDEQRAFRAEQGLAGARYVLSTDLGMAFRISKLPYAVLLDAAGRVRAKGLVNSREQVESLFVANELGVASVQDYLGHSQAKGAPAPAEAGPAPAGTDATSIRRPRAGSVA